MHKLSLAGSGGGCEHTAKLQARAPHASTPCVRLLAVPLHWTFCNRFGVPVLASNQIATRDGAEVASHRSAEPVR
jgi:hypothetical protein